MEQENYSNVTTQTETQTYNVHNLSETNCFPFNVLEHNEKFTPILGNTRVDENWFDTLEQCKEYILSKPYSLILALIGETIKIHKEYENEQKLLAKTERKSKKQN